MRRLANLKTLIIVVTIMTFAMCVFVSQAENNITDDSKALFKNIQLFTDSITLISADYVESVNMKDLIYGAIRGMMKTLDGYSQFLDPESFKEITEDTKGEFGGLGIEIGIRDGLLTVIAPMEDTPAFEAGIQAGDRIVKIEGEVARDLTLDETVKKLRGEPGTEVTISIVREGTEEILKFTITRAIIKVKSIKDVKILENDIGYVRILEFQERTASDLKKNIKKLRNEGAKSLIIDLRNNPGGLLTAAAEAADLFLEKGKMIVYTKGRAPEKRMEFKSKKMSDFDDMALILLVDKGSASASEILAGALKDNKRAMIVGVTTFGKGSVQTVIPLQDEAALRLTTAAYYTPSGENLMNKGIEPDIFVEKKKLAEKGSEEKKEDKDEAARQEYDNQIQAAVNVLTGVQVFEKYKVPLLSEDSESITEANDRSNQKGETNTP